MAHSPADSSSSSAPFLARRSPSPSDEAYKLEDKQRTSTHARTYADNDNDDDEIESVDDADLETLVTTNSPPPPYHEKSARWARHKPTGFRSVLRSPKMIAIAAILLFLVAFGIFAALYVSHGDDIHSGVVAETDVEDTGVKTLATSEYVLGSPTESFKGSSMLDADTSRIY